MNLIEEARAKNKQEYTPNPYVPNCGNCVHLVIGGTDVIALLGLFGDEPPIITQPKFAGLNLTCEIGQFKIERNALCRLHKNYKQKYYQLIRLTKEK